VRQTLRGKGAKKRKEGDAKENPQRLIGGWADKGLIRRYGLTGKGDQEEDPHQGKEMRTRGASQRRRWSANSGGRVGGGDGCSLTAREKRKENRRLKGQRGGGTYSYQEEKK